MGARLHFWLLAMDVVAWGGGFGSKLYLWCVGKASDATDWGEAVPQQSGTGEGR